MAFPDDIETGIGLAGPTADIGHEDAHAASGIPRLLEAIQTSIGTDAGVDNVWTPTWNTGSQPSTITSRWAKYGPMLWINVYVNWPTATTASYTLKITGGFPAWGTIWSEQAGVFPWMGFYQGQNGLGRWTGTAFEFYRGDTNTTYTTVEAQHDISFNVILWTE